MGSVQTIRFSVYDKGFLQNHFLQKNPYRTTKPKKKSLSFLEKVKMQHEWINSKFKQLKLQSKTFHHKKLFIRNRTLQS